MLTESLVSTILQAVLAIAVPLGVGIFYRYTGIKIEEKHATWLQQAILTGVANFLAKRGVTAGSLILGAESGLSAATRSEAMTSAIAYARSSVPDAIKALGASDDVMAKIAQSKLVLLAAAPETAKPPG